MDVFRTQNLSVLEIRNKNVTQIFVVSLFAKSVIYIQTFIHCKFVYKPTLHCSNEFNNFIVCHHKLSFHVTLTMCCKCVILIPTMSKIHFIFSSLVYRVAPKNGTVDMVDVLGLCSDQQLSFFTLLDRPSFPHYNNTKIIKFG